MNTHATTLIAALRSAVIGEATMISEPSNWDEVLNLARSHKVTALLYAGLKNSNFLHRVPQLMQNTLLQEYRKTVYWAVQLEQCCKEISNTLDRVQIDYVFLKGAILKKCYPTPELRTMSDIDMLVRAEDRDKLIGAFAALGAKQEAGDGNHYNFCFPQGIHVECHPNLVHPTAPYGTEMNPGWQYCVKRQEGSGWEMTADGLYLHTLCHLSEHFLSGGVGVRFVLDLWLLRKKMGDQLNESFLQSELRRMQLLEFAQNIDALGEKWFGEGNDYDLLELEEYILSSGSHGFAERAALNEVSISGKGKEKAALKRVLYSREQLENRYPWSRRSVLLLPAAWCARAFVAVTKRRYIINKWLKNAKSVSQDQVKAQRELLSRFGLRPKT